MASRGRVSRPWLCRLSMLVGLLAASLAAAAPMATDGTRGTRIHEVSLQPAAASKQHAQRNVASDVALSSKTEKDECVDWALPPSANLKTCQEQKDHGFCTKEHNQWPGGYCVRTCGNCPQQAQVGVVQPPPSTTVKEESLAAAGSVCGCCGTSATGCCATGTNVPAFGGGCCSACHDPITSFSACCSK